MNEPDTHDETPQATDHLELDEFVAQCDLETPPEQLDAAALLETRVLTSRILGMLEGIATAVDRLDGGGVTARLSAAGRAQKKQATALEELTDEYLPRVRARAINLETEFERRIDHGEINLEEEA
jgi:hypothetical protein